MALRNPKRFGLDVNKEFADTQDKNLCLRNLNLPIFDLDVIRGSSAAGASTDDFISFSRLKVPIHKTTRRFQDDSSTFISRLDDRAGIERILFGNLDINGRLSGNAIRYRYVDFDDGNAIKIADISTSRASAWSSTVPEPIPNTAPISYGAEVKTIGDLVFGTQTTTAPFANKPRLQTSQVPLDREFDSELPTHKMKVTIGNTTYNMFLMKGIPIIFRGFFRSLSASISLNLIQDSNGVNIPASWKIVERSKPQNYSNFENQGGNTSSISFRSTVGKERLIQFYYNPEKITSISIPSAAISELPAVKFENCLSFNFSSNRLANFPDFVSITPKLVTLTLSNNQFYYGEVVGERRITAAVMSKIPTTLQNLNLSSSFRGSIDLHVIADRLPELRSLSLSGGHFGDDNNTNSPFPTVAVKVTSYSVPSNDLRAVITGNTGAGRYAFTELPDLETLNVAGNYYAGGTFTIVSSKLRTVSMDNTGFGIPDLLNSQSTLERFSGTYMRGAGSFFNVSGNYKFANFNVLTNLNFSRASLGGAFPIFTNNALSTLNLEYTSIVGGTYDGDTTYVIPANTFTFAPSLTSIRISSSSLLTSPIHPDAFSNLSLLTTLHYYSFGRTSGAVPNLGGCPNLSALELGNNNFTGNLPSLNSLNNLGRAYLNNNSFSGTVPAYKNLSNLKRLYIHNNQLEALSKFSNLPNLEYFYAHNNIMEGTIPSFADCPRLYYLILFNNNFEFYTQGSLSTLYRIKYIDLSGNNLTQQSVDDILSDLLANYNAVNRRGVTVNLRGNAIPSEVGQENLEIIRSKGWTVTTS